MTQVPSSQDTPATEPHFTLAAQIAGEGQDLLLFHGGSGSRNHWLRNIDALAAHFRVFALDLPGFGESPDLPAATGPDGYVQLLHAAVDRLELSGGPLSLVGFSFGGAVAAALARRLAHRVTRLSLIGPAGFSVPKERRLDLRSLKDIDGTQAAIREVIRHNLAMLMLASPDSLTEEAIALHQANILRTRFDSRSLSLRDSLQDDLAQLRCPVQIIWGERDRLAYPSLAVRAELCRNALPSVQIEMVPGAGHWTQFESAQEVNHALLAFLCR